MVFLDIFSQKPNYSNSYLICNTTSIKTKSFPSLKKIKIFIKDSEEFISLDGVAFDAWRLMNKRILFEDLIKKLKNIYDVPEEELKRDLIKFISSLEKNNLVKITKEKD